MPNLIEPARAPGKPRRRRTIALIAAGIGVMVAMTIAFVVLVTVPPSPPLAERRNTTPAGVDLHYWIAESGDGVYAYVTISGRPGRPRPATYMTRIVLERSDEEAEITYDPATFKATMRVGDTFVEMYLLDRGVGITPPARVASR